MIHKDMRYRRMQERAHKMKLREISKYCGYPGVWEHNGYYKMGRGSISKYLKRLSNKKVRRTPVEITLRRGDYRRVFDYWWELT